MIKRYLFLLGAAALSTGAVNAQKISLTKGQKLETVSNIKMVMSIEMMGQSIDNNTETSNTALIELKEINPSDYLFSNTVTKMLLHTSAMGQEVSFDSDKKEDMDGQMGESMKNVINKPQDIVVDKQGKILEKKGDTASGGMNDMMNMGNNLMKGQPFPALVTLPNHPVKTGDTWTDSTGTPATFKAVTTYTVKDINKDEVVLDFTSIVAKKGTIEQQQMQIDMDMTGTVKGTSSYEAATGLVKKSESTSNIKGTMGIMGQSAPMTMTVTASTVARKL
ncbi:MAG TPA: DUF6263 family protein [Chitinophagaceae bacterium]|nr:DUF6263 family protein [Chitinophagaceae bacterium]